MEECVQTDRIKRVLSIYDTLLAGGTVNRTAEAEKFGVSAKTIKRDIDDIRSYLSYRLAESGEICQIAYKRGKGGYQLQGAFNTKLSNSEILAVSKILLDSRAFRKEEMERLLDKLMECCVPKDNSRIIKELVQNEAFHYVEPRHKKKFLPLLWEIGEAVKSKKYIEAEYLRTKDHTVVKRRLCPVAILFSEYYFYMTAFIDDENVRKGFDNPDDIFPTIYRIDRIERLKVLDEHFYTPYKDRFEEGEFRKRIQFMLGGKLQTVKFEYSGPSIEAVLDRLPTARILDEKDGVYTISAEVFGKGIDIWLRGQGENVRVLG